MNDKSYAVDHVNDKTMRITEQIVYRLLKIIIIIMEIYNNTQ